MHMNEQRVTHISQKHCPNFKKFSAQVTCCRGSVPLMIVKCYVLPVLWTMSCFHLTGHTCIVRLMEKGSQSAGGNADGAELQADAAELSALPPAD